MSNILNSPSRLKKYIIKEYSGKGKSWKEIADALGTYPNKIIRFAKKNKIVESRDRSTAQKLALESGRHKHPTKGTHRTEDTKEKISDGMARVWEELDDEERERRREINRQQWEDMTVFQRDEMLRLAQEGVRKSSKEGSKLEKFLENSLTKANVAVEFHRERIVQGTKQQIDIFLPHLGVAIEVDGPAHFFPIWGQESLEKHIRADALKNGLLLKEGFVVIRIRHVTKNLSKKQMRDVWNELKVVVEKVEKRLPPKNKRFIEVEV
jgi:very-short-patch-repair endonuclease